MNQLGLFDITDFEVEKENDGLSFLKKMVISNTLFEKGDFVEILKDGKLIVSGNINFCIEQFCKRTKKYQCGISVKNEYFSCYSIIGDCFTFRKIENKKV